LTDAQTGEQVKVTIMHLSTLLYGVIYFAVAQQSAPMPNTVKIDDCIIFLADEAKVPAQEGGLIEKIHVKEGQQVKAGDPLVQIDDSIPQQQVNVAENEFNAAKTQAETKVPRKYAVASLAVAKAALKISLDANARVKGSVSQAEINKQELECTQMELSIEKADSDTSIALKQTEVKRAQWEAAQTALKHRQVTSPLDGKVRMIKQHVGEWVQTGEPMIHIVRMDRLRVEGSLNAADVSPSEVNDRPVEIEVKLARDRVEKFRGNIVFVDPMLVSGGDYTVWAEVENRAENGQWLLHPGKNAKMTIHLK
jgi:multidrug efflux pump subunit AcrA (membrane-fusion protein)